MPTLLLQIVATACLGHLCLLALGQLAKVLIDLHVSLWRGLLYLVCVVGVSALVILAAIWRAW